MFVGGLIGGIFGEKAIVLKPFGDLFLNLLFMIIIPLIFFSITSSIAGMSGMTRLRKIMKYIFIVFITTSFIAAIFAIICVIAFNPAKGLDINIFKQMFSYTQQPEIKDISYLSQLVNTLTVNDFLSLFQKEHMFQLIFFAVLFGISILMVGKKAKPVIDLLNSGNEIIMGILKLIMYYAPIGLGCYFAVIVGSFGSQIVNGYANVFVLYLAMSIIYYFGFLSLYVYIAVGKKGLQIYWKNIIAPSITAMATCSSIATMPVNMDSSIKMGVPKDIAETVIPIGSISHKEGSVIGCILKMFFIFTIFGYDFMNPTTIASMLVMAIFLGVVIAAVPGGAMLDEIIILTFFGLPKEALPLLVLISTIIDIPATVLNVASNSTSSLLVTRFVERRN